MLRPILLLTSLLLALSLTTVADAKPIKVVATFTIVGEMASEVGGKDVQVTTIVGPDGDAHVFEPMPAHLKAVSDADIVIANGLGLEPWLDRLISASGYRGKVAIASDGVKPLEMEEHGSQVSDPHAWQDLANGRLYVVNIAKALSVVAPESASIFQANAHAYATRLTDLESWVRSEISAVPAAKRKIITTHDAFGYFGKAYGIQLLAPVGLSTEAEPTAQGLAQLSRQMKAEHVKAIFLENMSDPRLIQSLAKDAGASVGGTLYADSLSRKDGPAPTYEAMFQHNVPLLRNAMLRN